ncbi:hypothetical protein [Mycobacterium camsae]|uniref:hypothetical protein n=1 Tax=Mycobacterium gordonae TaxID=1778 RepID=UPI00198135A5|nr:hypothetical protein [Mycobacterium gordonae]
MSAPDKAIEAPDAAGGPRRTRWAKARVWIGAIVTSAVVIPLLTLGVTSAVQWFGRKLNPEQYLSVAVVIPSPASADGGEGWVFDKSPAELRLPPEHGDVDKWADANGGIPASGNVIVVTLQGLHGHTVVVQSISVEIVSQTGPLQGTHLIPLRAKGLLPTYDFGLNLDARPVAVRAQADQRLPHSISSAQPEALRIAAVTNTCTCQWTATLRWSADDGEQGTTRLGDEGGPFRVAATVHATTVMLG